MAMHLRTLGFIALLTMLGCTGPDTTPRPGNSAAIHERTDTLIGQPAPKPHFDWQVLPPDSSVIVLGINDTLRIGATGLNLLTRLSAPSGKPWFLFSGRDTAGADGQRSLYVLSPGTAPGQGLQRSWHTPGRLLDADGKVFYEASVFAGEVLPDTVGVAWYERSLMPDGTWRLNTTVLRIDGLEPDTLVFFGQRRKSTTTSLAFKGDCRVLPGIDQRTAQLSTSGSPARLREDASTSKAGDR